MRKRRFAALSVFFLVAVFVAFFVGRASMVAGMKSDTAGQSTDPAMHQDRDQQAGAHDQHAAGQAPGSDHSQAVHAASQGKRKILYWRAPMDPNYISDKPGKSPMGMDLVPVYEDEVSGGGQKSGPGGEKTGAAGTGQVKKEGKRKILYWRAPMDPNYISDKPGKSPMGMDLVPVYEDEVSGGGQKSVPGGEKTVAAGTGQAQKEGKRKVLYWRAPMDPNYKSDKPGKSPMGMDLVPVYEDEVSGGGQKSVPGGEKTVAAGTGQGKKEGKRKILYWRAPMDPNYISDKPGKSPMGMDLVPVYEDEVSSGQVNISPAVVQQIGVTTTEVKKGPFHKTITTYGTSTWNEGSLAAMNAKIDGWIEKLNVNETGQMVKKGQPLVEIYSPQLLTAQQEYLSALADARSVGKSSYGYIAEASRQLPEAARMRLKLWDISDAQIAELRKTGKVRRTLILHAPIDGIVTERDVVAGEYVKAGQNLARIADLRPIWLMVSLYEDEIPLVKKGMKASVNFDSLPGETFQGTVGYLYPYLKGKSRTAEARVVLPNTKEEILPQMYGTVKISVPVSAEALQVPNNAVIRASSTDNVVFVALGEGRFSGRKVVVGPLGDNEMLMIKAGLRQGERVVTSAQFLLDSESQLREAIQAMLSHGGHGK